MVEAIWRRGPDDSGEWHSPDDLCWFGFRRLSIIDVATGHQPMANEDNSIWIVFNGEIYNYQELRSQLKSAGHKFRTQSDTEVLIHGYEEWGMRGLLDRLRGIFAFAIFDSTKRLLLLARDQLGVKPLHYWTDGNVLLFGSEIKSLLPYPALRDRKVNKAGLAQFLVTRYVSRPHTMFEGVKKLPEGSWLEVSVGRGLPTVHPYWDVDHNQHAAVSSLRDAVEQTDRLLRDTVRMQLMSEVPLGAQLSGGVDSSIIVGMMETIRKEDGQTEPVKTFSVGFDVEEYSELQYARRIAERYGTEHHEFKVGYKDFIDEFPLLCWIYDEPVGEPPAIPTYFMCKGAKPHVTVMLTGEGADEQFGGYMKYAFDEYSKFVDWLPKGLRRSLLQGIGKFMPFKARRLRSVAEILSLEKASERYASWYGALDTSLQSTLLNPELRDTVGDRFLSETFGELLSSLNGTPTLEKFMYCDIHTRLVDDLLVKGDRMSMGASIEARVPFLDHHVVQWAASLPPEYKVKGMKTKILLKKLAERYAPMENIYRRKVGFTVPLSEWFVGPLKDMIREVLLSEKSMSRGYFRPDALTTIVEDHLNRKVDREQGIWVLLALEIWHRLFVDDDGSEAAVDRVKEDLSRTIAVAHGTR